MMLNSETLSTYIGNIDKKIARANTCNQKLFETFLVRVLLGV